MIEILIPILFILVILWGVITPFLLLARLKELNKDDPSTIFNWGINLWITIFTNPYKEDKWFNFLVWNIRIIAALFIIRFLIVLMD